MAKPLCSFGAILTIASVAVGKNIAMPIDIGINPNKIKNIPEE